jgi:hypothetical protein
MINIYCDESCHLENDLSNIMVLGSISCPKSKIKEVNNKIREIKTMHNISRYNETKWVKVSKGKLDYYKELVEYFADCKFLKFRSLVVTDKSKLRHSDFNQNHNSFYYKMYYLLLKGKMLDNEHYNIYLDMKDTQMYERSQLLLTYLRSISDDKLSIIISKIQPVQSNEIELMQLVDLFTGMITYRNRGLNSSHAKIELIDFTEQKLNKKLNIQTRLYEPKFNIFKWEPDYYEGRNE